MNNPLTQDMRTHAIGRLLFDLPTGFEMRIGSDVELIYGLTSDFVEVKVQVLDVSASRQTFDQLVQLRLSSLKTSKTVDQSRSLFDALIEVGPNSVLLRSLEDSLSTTTFVSETLLLLKNSVVVSAKEVSFKNTFTITESRLQKLQDQIFLPNDPTKPGRGFVLGPILINGDHDHEVGTLSYANPAVPEVNLKLMMRALTENPEETLLRRFDSKKHLLVGMPGKLKTLRRGKVTVAERYGEEMLNEVIVDGERKTWTFDAEVIRDQPAFSAPLLNIYFTLGRQVKSEHVNPSWSETEATAVWDAMLKSLRPRPGAV